MFFIASTFVLYLLGIALAHSYYGLINELLGEQDLEIPVGARFAHIMLWPVAMMVYLIFPNKNKEVLRDDD